MNLNSSSLSSDVGDKCATYDFWLRIHARYCAWAPLDLDLRKKGNIWFETSAGFPLKLENLEKWEGIFQSGKSQGILNRLEKSGKITQNTGKLQEFEINIIWYF